MQTGTASNATTTLAPGRHCPFNQFDGGVGIVRQVGISSQEFGNDLGWRSKQLASDSHGLFLAIKITEPDLIIAPSPLDMKFGSYDCELLVAGRLFSRGSFIRGVHFVAPNYSLLTDTKASDARPSTFLRDKPVLLPLPPWNCSNGRKSRLFLSNCAVAPLISHRSPSILDDR
jgi:hypothetical protein